MSIFTMMQAGARGKRESVQVNKQKKSNHDLNNQTKCHIKHFKNQRI